MSDFTKSIVYSGFVLVAGLIAIFAISSNMTAQQGPNAIAIIEPAAGDEAQNPIAETATFGPVSTEDTDASSSNEALQKLREALAKAGVDVSGTEPAAGDETPAEQAPQE